MNIGTFGPFKTDTEFVVDVEHVPGVESRVFKNLFVGGAPLPQTFCLLEGRCSVNTRFGKGGMFIWEHPFKSFTSLNKFNTIVLGRGVV